MRESHCRSCFRALHREEPLCAACAAGEARLHARRVLVLGTLAVPLMIAGMLRPDPRLMLAGGVIAGVSVILYVVLLLR